MRRRAFSMLTIRAKTKMTPNAINAWLMSEPMSFFIRLACLKPIS